MIRFLAALLTAALLAAPLVAQRSFGRVSRVQLEDPLRRTGVISTDVDGDGITDLVIATVVAGQPGKRALRLHRGRAGATLFRNEPDAKIDLPKDVTGFSVADVHPDAGAEIVLYNARAAVAWRPGVEGRERFQKLFDCRFLWQVPDGGRTIAFQEGVGDLDGDGLDDLLVPEPGSYLVAFQRREGTKVTFAREARLEVPPDRLVAADDGAPLAEREPGKLRFSVPLKGDPNGVFSLAPPLLLIQEVVPKPHILDFDADGRLDVICRTARSLHVFSPDGSGMFGASPAITLPVPVVADRARRVDISYSTHLLDVNDDGRADCIFFAGNQRSDEARTQVLIFVQGQEKGATLFGDQGVPPQLLLVAGFAGQSHFHDVDGDGFRDLVVGALRPDLIDKLRSSASDTVDTELFVFRNQRGRFSRKPDLRFEVPVKLEGARSLERGFLARFAGDLTGDGVSELMVRDRPTRLRIHMTRRGRKGLEVLPRPLWELVIDKKAELVLTPRPGSTPELLVLEQRQVLHVRFGS